MKKSVLFSLVFVLFSISVSAASEESVETDQEYADAFRQLLPRGGIPSIDNPVFVSPEEAELPDNAWVFGVVMGGEARAYSLNLLNRYEVVNDRVRDRSFAAVW